MHLSQLLYLRSVSFKDPMSPPNPVSFLCNYSTYILYHIATLTRLDSYDVHQKSLKDFAEVININPANIYLFKVNNRNTRNRCEICSKLTIKTPEQRLFLLF